MNRNSSAYLFCLLLIMTVFCSAVPGMSMENSPAVAPHGDKCSTATEKYKEGVQLLNYEARRAAFQKAVDLCPSYAEAHVNLADAFENLGLIKKAVFTEPSQIDGDKLLDQAETHYKKAIELKRNLIAPRLGLAIVSIAQGRYPVAVQNYEEVLRLKPEQPYIRERLEVLRKIDPADDEDEQHNKQDKKDKKFKTSKKIIAQIKNIKNLGSLNTMGFEDSVVRDIENRPRQSFNNILFGGWSAVIQQGDPIMQLNEIGEALTSQEMALFKFVIEGHANTVGSFEDNMTVSKNRAKAVKEYLVKHYNINPNRILTQGFGFTKLKYDQGNDPRNRRVEVVFFNEDSKK